tara:strand:- start:1241 stop:2524 length:1284 start_codon:yes stop_codon:yes gene_type:complete
MNLKNTKNFKGNKRGAPWILKPVDIQNKTMADIPKLKPEEVNIYGVIRPAKAFDDNGKRMHQKLVKLCRLSELGDRDQVLEIFGKINDYKTTLPDPSSVKTGAETRVKDMFHAYLQNPKVKLEANHNGKRHHLKVFAEYIGEKILMEIKPEDVRQAKAKLLLPNKHAKRGDCLMGKTVNNYLRTLRTAFDWATKTYDNFEMNPVYFVETEVQESFEHRDLSDEERATLFGVIRLRTNPYLKTKISKELHDFVTWGIWVGSRKGETMALRWDNIDFKKEEITFDHAIQKYECAETKMVNGELICVYNKNVRRKGLKNNSKQRTISFAELPQIRKLLRKRWSERSSVAIFTEDCRSAWESCLKEAGIENFNYHGLRKTCGSYLYQNDESLEDIAYYLGHRSTATTELIYVKKNNEASKKMGRALQKRMA